MADVVDTVELGNLDSENETEVETLENNSNKNLQPPEGTTSVVWKFFGFDADKDGRILVSDKRKQTNVNFNRCKKKLKYTGGTSNLHYHLDKHHKAEYEQAIRVATEESGRIRKNTLQLEKYQG